MRRHGHQACGVCFSCTGMLRFLKHVILGHLSLVAWVMCLVHVHGWFAPLSLHGCFASLHGFAAYCVLICGMSSCHDRGTFLHGCSCLSCVFRNIWQGCSAHLRFTTWTTTCGSGPGARPERLRVVGARCPGHLRGAKPGVLSLLAVLRVARALDPDSGRTF